MTIKGLSRCRKGTYGGFKDQCTRNDVRYYGWQYLKEITEKNCKEDNFIPTISDGKKHIKSRECRIKENDPRWRDFFIKVAKTWEEEKKEIELNNVCGIETEEELQEWIEKQTENMSIENQYQWLKGCYEMDSRGEMFLTADIGEDNKIKSIAEWDLRRMEFYYYKNYILGFDRLRAMDCIEKGYDVIVELWRYKW